jgi:hypothetical protein
MDLSEIVRASTGRHRKPAAGRRAPATSYMVRAMPAPVLQFIDETLGGEMLREHEVLLQAARTVKARDLLQLRFGDNVDVACEAFTRGAFRMQIDGAQIDSLDARVQLVPGLSVKLIRVVPAEH